ncbi:MAG: ATP-dependent helicase [Lachnospiraceae bacterium]|nr:ATP-dependent helicase [Lachnospiraceae bacterium]
MEDKRCNSRGNAAQMRAITHGSGPCMVLAGPGSGKTFVIVERIKSLIEQKDVDPGGILTITFTRKAAAQMRQRFLRISEGRYPQAVFGTFHSIFYQILKLSETDQTKGIPKLITEQQKSRIVFMLFEDVKKSAKDLNVTPDMIRECISEISRLKGQGFDEGAAGDRLAFAPVFPEIFAGYNRMLDELGLLDFDDMILRCLDILKRDEGVLKKWQDRFTHILIDEYQDINSTQSEAISLIALPQNNIFVVGDDDQSIYGFRGSRPDIMLGFAEKYEGAVTINLDVNYRSVQEIIDVSGAVICENRNRFEKRSRSGVGTAAAGQAVSLREYKRSKDELDAIAGELSRVSDISRAAVIVRTNALAEHIAGELNVRGIQTCHTGSAKDPYAHREIEDILAYLRLCGKNPKLPDLIRVINRPFRYLPRDFAGNTFRSVDDIILWYRDRPSLKKNAEAFVRDIKMTGGMRPALAIRYIRTKIGYDRFVKASGEFRDADDAIARLDALMEDAGGYDSTPAFLKAITAKREMPVASRNSDRDNGGVQIMTMHASKGLEFDTVWLPGLNEGTIPSKKIESPAQIEEERRLLYVAMTRARSRLIMSYITGTESANYVPSRYLIPVRDMTDKQQLTS